MIESYKVQVKYAFSVKVPAVKKFDHIIVLGMGGSALAGELLRDVYEEKPVVVVRGYDLPAYVRKKSLVLAVSYSGNTEETLSLFQEAKHRGCQIISLASDGKLEKIAGKNFVRLPSGLQPRNALPSMILILLRILGFSMKKENLFSLGEKMKKSEKIEVRGILDELKKGKIPAVYGGSEGYRGLALCWKSMFNENTKLLCHTGVFSEVNHNDIESQGLEKFVFILLDDPTVRGRLKKQIEFADKVFHFSRIELKGDALLERIFHGLLMGSILTREFASLKGRDFSRVEKIEALKKFLKK